MGHGGMLGVWDHITSPGFSELARMFSDPYLSGPKSRWLGADFGPKPLKRAGPGAPVPLRVTKVQALRETSGVTLERLRFTGVYRRGWSLRQTTSKGAALKIEL